MEPDRILPLIRQQLELFTEQLPSLRKIGMVTRGRECSRHQVEAGPQAAPHTKTEDTPPWDIQVKMRSSDSLGLCFPMELSIYARR